MATAPLAAKKINSRPNHLLLGWRTAQALVWLIGAGILLALIFYPGAGLLLMWNVLIPLAPALLVLSCGIWRNLCPLATTNLMFRHLNLSKKKKMSVGLQAKLQVSAVVALFAIVPLRHLVFNTNGPATAALIVMMAITGISLGLVYDWKSAWCNSLCPIHPVEKLYGQNAAFAVPNAHCTDCVKCSVPCPDSTPNIHPSASKKTIYNQLSGLLTIGGLPGFIFGWFFVPDYAGPITLPHLFEVYRMPALGFCVSCMLYIELKRYISKKNHRTLISCFAAAGVSGYYWFRIPALLGFGRFSSDIPLINLKSVLPYWSILLAGICLTVFFFWWLVFRKPSHKSWVLRPPYAAE